MDKVQKLNNPNQINKFYLDIPLLFEFMQGAADKRAIIKTTIINSNTVFR